MKELLHKFATWLWLKTYTVTATEIMIIKGLNKPRKCVYCGLSPIHLFDKSLGGDLNG